MTVRSKRSAAARAQNGQQPRALKTVGSRARSKRSAARALKTDSSPRPDICNDPHPKELLHNIKFTHAHEHDTKTPTI
jgi:hypothetical protein